MTDKELMLRAIEALEAYQRHIVLPWRMMEDERLLEELRKAAAVN